MPSQRSFKAYGAKGICVEAEWHSFEAFLRDMGEQPNGLTLERRDSAENYCKANCRWASRLEQARNKTTTLWLEFGGRRLALTEWAAELGIAPKTLRARIADHGWSVERALTTPVMSSSESGKLAAAIRHGHHTK